jgi:hypothetical protein
MDAMRIEKKFRISHFVISSITLSLKERISFSTNGVLNRYVFSLKSVLR